VDTDLFEDLVPLKCCKCGAKQQSKWITKGKGPSPTLSLNCQKCNNNSRVETSQTWKSNNTFTLSYILLLVSILLTGGTWEGTAGLFGLMEMSCGNKGTYHSQAVLLVDKAVTELVQEFIAECRKQVVNRHDVYLMVDAGWSHPGWWARECTVIGIDCETGLPIAIFHVVRGQNYEGSSKGT
jgi:hypothetical protein